MRTGSGEVFTVSNETFQYEASTPPPNEFNYYYGSNDTNKTWSDHDAAAAATCYYPSSTGDFLTSTVFHTIIYVSYSVVFVTSLFGNGLVCFVVHSSPRMKTVTNYFIENLAIGDILMTLFCVPFSFVSMLILRYWPFGAVMCKVVNYSQTVSVLVSAYTLLAISIDRYIVIMHPLKPRLGKTSAKVVVALVWVGAFATAAPILIVTSLKKPSSWHEFCGIDVCLEQWEYPRQSEQYTYALLILQFLLPLSALVCTYTRIACAVWGGRPPGEADSERDTRLHRSKRKMVKMMLMVVTVFIVCWLPLNIFILLWTMHENDEDWGRWPGMPYVWFVSHWLAMSHCCYNPIIYCYMNTKYRHGFQQVLSCIVPARSSDLPSRHRFSMVEGIPMTDVVGFAGISRRGTSSSGCVCRATPRGGTSCSSCSSRRGFGSRNRTPTPPIRALSVRPHFN